MNSALHSFLQRTYVPRPVDDIGSELACVQREKKATDVVPAATDVVPAIIRPYTLTEFGNKGRPLKTPPMADVGDKFGKNYASLHASLISPAGDRHARPAPERAVYARGALWTSLPAKDAHVQGDSP